MRLSATRIRELIDEAIVDANGGSEARVGFLTMIEEDLALLFTTRVLGIGVLVERVDINAAEEIVAVCRSGKATQRISILDLPLPKPTPKGAEWIEAYRHWARLAPDRSRSVPPGKSGFTDRLQSSYLRATHLHTISYSDQDQAGAHQSS